MIAKTFREGDEFYYRLLLYLSKLTGEKFQLIQKIKHGVWVCFDGKKKWVLKEFSSNIRLRNQILLTELLHKYEFNHTYRFHPIHMKVDIIFEDQIYGLFEYIEKSPKTFTFQNHENRNQALQLLKKYHEITSHFHERFTPLIKKFDQLEKWDIRLNEFKKNLPALKKEVPDAYRYFQVYLDWAEWSLQHLHSHNEYFVKGPLCIIHGDVAYHNFYLDIDNMLNIIDFDLISLAPSKVDILQLANRMLPSLSWSCEKLWNYESFQALMTDKEFLYALIYPSDILREWNRYSKSHYKRKKFMNYLYQITVDQFNERQIFAKKVNLKL